MSTTVCTAKATCKKLPGLLELTDTHLHWTQDGKKAPSIRVSYAEASSLFCSKEGAAQVRLKLGLVGDDNGHNFTFTSPPHIAVTEREKFKKELTNIISRNRSTQDGLPKPIQPSLSLSNSLPVSSAPTPAITTPKPTAPPLRLSDSRAPSVPGDSRRPTPVFTGNDPASDFRLRKKVLMSNPELGTLHRDLVMSGQITEAEFWDGREHLIIAQYAAEGQKKGKPGQLVDPRPETVEGEVRILITPQLVHDIFDEYPVVGRAFSENVPNKLTKEQFWKRYFQSKLFNAHRASIRSSATQHVVKDDPIFDKYLDKEDDELEPRRQRNEQVDAFVNLVTTMEDHEETGNERDITMQAGRQKAALPLIRKFNEHSERLLNSALGELPPPKRQRRDYREGSYPEIDLDDLHELEVSSGIMLEMQDRQRYFDALTLKEGEELAKQLDPSTVLEDTRTKLLGVEDKLTQLKIDRKAGDAALIAMTTNVANHLDGKARKNDIPEGLFRQMTACQTAANEFLRQFWLVTYPLETQISLAATPAQRATKAAKMIGYISKTAEKVQGLVDVAQYSGIDPTRVKNAMKPIVQASEQALSYYRNKKLRS